jgi:hypothetical protein
MNYRSLHYLFPGLFLKSYFEEKAVLTGRKISAGDSPYPGMEPLRGMPHHLISRFHRQRNKGKTVFAVIKKELVSCNRKNPERFAFRATR